MASLSVAPVSSSGMMTQNHAQQPQSTLQYSGAEYEYAVEEQLSQDEVSFSLAARIKQLYSAGRTVRQIASMLNVDKKTVESYLVIAAKSTLNEAETAA